MTLHEPGIQWLATVYQNSGNKVVGCIGWIENWTRGKQVELVAYMTSMLSVRSEGTCNIVNAHCGNGKTQSHAPSTGGAGD